ncbi:MAG: HD domain-containing protein [Desulfobacterales bacterium]|nr:HD domain-containing protein [Desulfobacterales bacterium]
MHDTVKQLAIKHFQGARGSHNWDHTLRVCRLCEHIGTTESVDMDVLLPAAYLHDIGRSCQDNSNGTICHAEKGARMAGPIVEQLPLSEDQKNNILHCIRTHRFRGDHEPKTLEAMVLFDADKLDAIGAVGVARAFLFAGEVGARLHSPEINIEDTAPYSMDDTGYREFKVKLCKIKDRILTREGRKLAGDRHRIMEDFFNRFLEEYEGKR